MDAYTHQTVSLERRAGGYDVHAQPAMAAPVTLAARVQQRTKMVRGKQGEQLLSDAQVYLAAGTSVSPGDVVTYDGQEYEVISVARGQGLDAETHVVAYLGRR